MGRSAVERVTDDGCSEAFGVGTVHTELVCASRGGGKAHEGRLAIVAEGEGAEHEIVGMSLLAVLVIDPHPGAVVVVGS